MGEKRLKRKRNDKNKTKIKTKRRVRGKLKRNLQLNHFWDLFERFYETP